MPWTEAEKLQLLRLLNRYGAGNLPAIMEELPYKTLIEVKSIISYYQSLAQVKVQNQRGDLRMDVSPIDKWISTLKEIKGRHISLDHVSRALKYIALYEKKAKSDVNLR